MIDFLARFDDNSIELNDESWVFFSWTSHHTSPEYDICDIERWWLRQRFKKLTAPNLSEVNAVLNHRLATLASSFYSTQIEWVIHKSLLKYSSLDSARVSLDLVPPLFFAFLPLSTATDLFCLFDSRYNLWVSSVKRLCLARRWVANLRTWNEIDIFYLKRKMSGLLLSLDQLTILWTLRELRSSELTSPSRQPVLTNWSRNFRHRSGKFGNHQGWKPYRIVRDTAEANDRRYDFIIGQISPLSWMRAERSDDIILNE